MKCSKAVDFVLLYTNQMHQRKLKFIILQNLIKKY